LAGYLEGCSFNFDQSFGRLVGGLFSPTSSSNLYKGPGSAQASIISCSF
jgi:hypothetical protein